MTILSNIKKTQQQQQQNVTSSNNENDTINSVLVPANSVSSNNNQMTVNASEVPNEGLTNNVNTVNANDTNNKSTPSSLTSPTTENLINSNNVTIQTNSQSGDAAKHTDKVKKKNEDESKTVNIQINDIQTANEVVNMPITSSSSNSCSPCSNSQTETGCDNTNTNPNNNNSNSNNLHNNTSSSKNKKLHSKSKIKSNKKRKLSADSSIHVASTQEASNLINKKSVISSSTSHQTPADLDSTRILNEHIIPRLFDSVQTSTTSFSSNRVLVNHINNNSNNNNSNNTENNQRRTITSTNNPLFDNQVASNSILKLNEPLVIETSVNKPNNDDSDNNNDSDSDFDFLNKTDNQISDDDEDSDLNTQYKQNLINQQILRQQQLYLQQQQQQQQHLQLNHNENLNILTNTNQSQNSRKKLTKKKGAKGHKMNLLGSRNTISIKENLKQKENDFEQTVNSEDEYEHRPTTGRNLNALMKNSNSLQNVMLNADSIEELEAKFSQLMKEKKGFIIKPMKEDGACLFRAVSDQVYGDEEMHSTIRCQCMDYIAKNGDYFKQYMTEEIDRYLSRKRQDTCHGNHIEIIAIAEIYNRPIEVYEYSIEPKNTFQSAFETDNEPLRLSYHGRNHYNSVVNPYKATIGVGLGLPQLTPGLAEKNLMNEALKKSEEFHLEKKMLDDKKKATDWEATNEEIMELVARESYMQWLKDNEKRNTSRHSLNINNNQFSQTPCNASCSTWGDQPPSASLSSTSLTGAEIRLSPPRHNQRHNLQRVNSNRRTSAGTPPHSPSQSKLSQLKTSPKFKNEPHSSKRTLTTTSSSNLSTMINSNSDNTNNIAVQQQQAQSQYQYHYEPTDELRSDMFGIGNNDWLGLDNQTDGDGDSDILARVLAASQQEYLESLKAKRQNQHS